MKIIFSDIDGTFSRMQEVPEVNVEAVKAVEDAGHRFVFVSGRSYQDIDRLLKDCQIDCDYIYGNGAGFRIMGEEPILEHYIPKNEYDHWERILVENNAFYYLHTNHGVIMQPLDDIMHHFDHLSEVYKEEFGNEIALNLNRRKIHFAETATFVSNPFAYLREHDDVKLIKFELLNGEKDIREKIAKLASDFGYYAFNSVLINLEIVPPNSNKGNGIKRYLENFNTVERTYGFGDAMNDLEMFNAVDVSIAAKGSADKIQDICDIVLNEEIGSYIFNEILK